MSNVVSYQYKERKVAPDFMLVLMDIRKASTNFVQSLGILKECILGYLF